MHPRIRVDEHRNSSLTDHYHCKAYKKQYVSAALEFFKFRFLHRLLLCKMPANRHNERFDVLFVAGIFTIDLVPENRVSFSGIDGVRDVLFEDMAQLPFVNRRRVMHVEVFSNAVLIY